MKRMAVLFSRLSGYMAACLRTLQEHHDVTLLVIRIPPSEDAPFNNDHVNWIDRLYDRDGLDRKRIQALLEGFDPDALYIAGWFDEEYLHVARAMRKQMVPVVSGCDRQWEGTLRQQVGRVIAPWYLHSAIDVLWVPGDRQRQLAYRLGYRGMKCWSGVYACDWDRFSQKNGARNDAEEPVFLFVGRYVKEKGLDTLLAAYRLYRKHCVNPWPLVCAGSGPLQHMIEEADGVINRGFVQPADLPQIMQMAGAFVLPSRHEPWGVVIQEAAASKLPLICSDVCGATTHLLQHGYNGFRFESGNSDELAHWLVRMSQRPHARRVEMGRRSYELSKQFTPERWAETLITGLGDLARVNNRGSRRDRAMDASSSLISDMSR